MPVPGRIRPSHERARDCEGVSGLREAGVGVLLYGPPGTGRTSLIEAAFLDLITVAGDGSMRRPWRQPKP
ncbi:hypothetical protein JCM4914_01320 [Streptomyces platensis subsp. malvinus]